MPRPWSPTDDELAVLLAALRDGVGLETAAKLIGVHGRTIQRHIKRANQSPVDAMLANQITEARQIGLAHLSHHRQRNIHGRVPCYIAGCRCSLCTEANRVHHADKRATMREKFARGEVSPKRHGLATYQVYGCRCPVCYAAASEANAQRQRLRPNSITARS